MMARRKQVSETHQEAARQALAEWLAQATAAQQHTIGAWLNAQRSVIQQLVRLGCSRADVAARLTEILETKVSQHDVALTVRSRRKRASTRLPQATTNGSPAAGRASRRSPTRPQNETSPPVIGAEGRFTPRDFDPENL
ncbi:MAG: hypothetical protein ACYDHM_12080 [Acidiferrobacterales bacterium]